MSATEQRQFQATSTSFAANLRRLRSAAGMSQTDLASRIAVTQTAISYWESGKRQPSFDDLDDLAVALAATVADLVNPPPPDRIPDPRVMHVTEEPPTGSVVATDWHGAHPEVWVSSWSNIGNWYSPDIAMRGDWHPTWGDVLARAEHCGLPPVLLVGADVETYRAGYAAGIRAAATAIENLG